MRKKRLWEKGEREKKDDDDEERHERTVSARIAAYCVWVCPGGTGEELHPTKNVDNFVEKGFLVRKAVARAELQNAATDE